MLVEAILSVCLATPINDWKGDRSTGPTCVYMNTGNRQFPVYNLSDLTTVMQQCMMWNSQGISEVQTQEHFNAIKKKLGYPKGAEPFLKAECHLQQYHEPFKCKDCEL